MALKGGVGAGVGTPQGPVVRYTVTRKNLTTCQQDVFATRGVGSIKSFGGHRLLGGTLGY